MPFINLLECFFPVGSVYISTIDSSPASKVGGSWVQIKGAMLAACGENDIPSNSYYGSYQLTVDQLPQHKHLVTWSSDDWVNEGSGNQNSSAWGGYSTKNTRTTSYTEPSGLIQGWGGQDNFIPYCFGLYVWRRTA